MFKKLLISLLLFLGIILHATPPSKVTVTKLYVATLDRAPDAAGLDFWVNRSGFTLEQIAMSFFDQKETQKKYPKGTSHREFIKAVYGNLFYRTPDSKGWDYWEQALESQQLSLSVFVLAVVNGALGDDAKIIANKTTVAMSFALAGRSDINEASNIITNITKDSQSVTQAMEEYGLSDKVVTPIEKEQIASNSLIDIVQTETPDQSTSQEKSSVKDIPQGIILKESFENLRANKGWHVEKGEVTGDHGIIWDTHTNGLEVQRGIVSDSANGDVHAELDAHHNVTISTQVALKSGANYELSFSIKPRGKNNKSDQKDTSAMEISLGDNVVSIESDKDAQLSTNFDNTNMSVITTSQDSGWTKVTITYTNITQDSNTLTIKGTGIEDSYGMLLDDIELRGDDSTVVTPIDTILKESFENLRNSKGWDVQQGIVTGDHGIAWDTHTNGLEVERGIVSATIDGDVHAELDAHHNVTISTQVALKSGANYELSFSIKPRGKNNKSNQKDTSAMEISLGDNVVSIESDKDGQLSTDYDDSKMSLTRQLQNDGWTRVSISYTNITQDSNTLTIKGTGASDGYGMLLDDIELSGENADEEASNTQLSNITDEAVSSRVQQVIEELEKIKIELGDVGSYGGDKLKQEYDGVKQRFDNVKKLLDDVKQAIDNSSLEKVTLKQEADDFKKHMDDLKKVIDEYKQNADNSEKAIEDIRSRIDNTLGVLNPSSNNLTNFITLTENTILITKDLSTEILEMKEENDTPILVISQKLLSLLEEGKNIFLPTGIDNRFPLGLSAKIHNINGTNITLSRIYLSDVVSKMNVNLSTYQLTEENFVDAIIPSFVTSNATSISTRKFNKNRISYLDGGLVFTKEQSAKNRSIFSFSNNLDTNIGNIDLALKLNLAKVTTLKTPSDVSIIDKTIKTDVVLKGAIKNLTLKQSYHIDLWEEKLKIFLEGSGNLYADLSLQGYSGVTLGYYEKAWKDVEKVAGLFGTNLNLLGLSTKDKKGKFPIIGLVFQSPVPTYIKSAKEGVTYGKAGALIVWVYFNAKAELSINGAIGVSVNTDFKLGLDKQVDSDFNLIKEFNRHNEERLIKAPYISGSIGAKGNIGITFEVDTIVSGLRFANGSMNIMGEYEAKFAAKPDISYGVDEIGGEWSFDDINFCFSGNGGAGVIFSTDVLLGINGKVKIPFLDEKDIDGTIIYNKQYPLQDYINQQESGWEGSWYKFEEFKECLIDEDSDEEDSSTDDQPKDTIQPAITRFNPLALKASYNLQTLDIYGSGFTPETRIEWYDGINNSGIIQNLTYIDSTHLHISSLNTATDKDEAWTITAINGDKYTSKIIQVEADEILILQDPAGSELEQIILSGSTTPATTCSFIDIDRTDDAQWWADYVEALCSAGIVVGYYTDYGPEYRATQQANWVEVLAVMNRVSDLEGTDARCQSDTYTNSEWYECHLDIATSRGFDNIDVNSKVTRGLAFQYAVKAFWNYNYSIDQSMQFLIGKGIISQDNRDSNINRAELAAVSLKIAKVHNITLPYGIVTRPEPKEPSNIPDSSIPNIVSDSYAETIYNRAKNSLGVRTPYVDNKWTYCARHVRMMHEKDGIYSNATYMCNNYENQGLLHTDTNPPKGSAICHDYIASDGVNYGHIAIATGDGKEIGATSLTYGIQERNIPTSNYRGWISATDYRDNY